jgi:hypothetical protein
MKSVLDAPEIPSDVIIEEVYTEMRKLDVDGYQEVMHLRNIEVKDKLPAFSILTILKQLVGIVMTLSVLKMLLFPTYQPSEAEKMAQFQIDLN